MTRAAQGGPYGWTPGRPAVAFEWSGFRSASTRAYGVPRSGRWEGSTLSASPIHSSGPQGPLPKLATLLQESKADLLAFYGFPADHWPKLRSINPLERVNGEIGARTHGIFPNDHAMVRLAASIVIEQNDEWLFGHRYLERTRSSL
jgi:hypothetical protein